MSGLGPAATLKNADLERIAHAAARVLAVDGKAMASQYLMSALENGGFVDTKNPKRSKLKGWEVHVVAERALWISQNQEGGAK